MKLNSVNIVIKIQKRFKIEIKPINYRGVDKNYGNVIKTKVYQYQ